jgi:para-aminobenzoate synthetase component 1
MTALAEEQKPFFFLIDFEHENPIVCPINEAEELGFYFEIKDLKNFKAQFLEQKPMRLSIDPVPKSRYSKAYKKVVKEIYQGNTFLLNLTFPSKIKTPLSLEDIFHRAKAPYKLYYKDHFVVYSPECFIKIKDGYIYSYPMKGTIDASLPNARKTLTNNTKEINEHSTIVDLIRNDLSKVARDVQVTRFRYIDKVKTQKNEIYHTSSEIRGKLFKDWKKQLPELLLTMLPAGSICGAPKEKTVSIIREVEEEKRGYYTGIFGYFDGENLDSAVNIRYLEKKEDQILYRSGGGITFMSNLESEYNELIEKIYVPVI